MNETQPSKSADVTDALSNALLRATSATAVVIAMDMEDGSTWYFTRGSTAQKRGLSELLVDKCHYDVEDAPLDDDDEEG
jgi:hypothetical protein